MSACVWVWEGGGGGEFVFKLILVFMRIPMLMYHKGDAEQRFGHFKIYTIVVLQASTQGVTSKTRRSAFWAQITN